MIERLVAIHYYLINRYYQLYTKHIVYTLKDSNGIRYTAYQIGDLIEKFTTGIADFKRALYDEKLRGGMDTYTLAQDIQTKLRYTYDKKVSQLFPLYELVSKEVESNMTVKCEIKTTQFDEIVEKSFLIQMVYFVKHLCLGILCHIQLYHV